MRKWIAYITGIVIDYGIIPLEKVNEMLKQDAKTLHIKEQLINDLATELTLIFSVTGDGEARIQLLGDILPFGNRDFQFNKDGKLVGTGTGVKNCCKTG